MNVMQQLGTDLTYGSVPGTPRSNKTFFGLHLYLAGKYCEKLNVLGAQLKVNRARPITLFVAVTIYCNFAIIIHLHHASFHATKNFLKKVLCNKIPLKKVKMK